MLVMSFLKPVTHLLFLSVSATMFLLPLVPILHPFRHLDIITPYCAFPLFLFLVSSYHFLILLPLCHWFAFCSLVMSVM